MTRERSVGGAAIEATTEAWDRYRRSIQVELSLITSPEGASIYIDGDAVGRTPRRVAIRPGTRTVRVTLDGYVSYEQTRDFVPGEPEQITLRLVREDDARAIENPEALYASTLPAEDNPQAPARSGGGTSAADWAIGGLLAIGGAVSAGLLIASLPSLGCDHDLRDRCIGDEKFFGTNLGLLAGGAVVGLGVGLLWLILAPLSGDGEPSDAQPAVSFGISDEGAQFQLRGSF